MILIFGEGTAQQLDDTAINAGANNIYKIKKDMHYSGSDDDDDADDDVDDDDDDDDEWFLCYGWPTKYI